jgi:anti-sigma regulatory factor (Ser/Thr protein kinase)
MMPTTRPHTTTLPSTYETRFAGEPVSVGQARAFVRQVLGEVPDVAATAVCNAEICVSELATNAIDHTRSGHPGGKYRLVVKVDGPFVEIGVEDQGREDGARPQIRRGWSVEESEHGRGLWMVAQLSAALHECPTKHGHLVTARINLHNPDGSDR